MLLLLLLLVFLVSVIKFKLLSLVFIKMVLYGAHEILFSCLLKASWGQAKPSRAEPDRARLLLGQQLVVAWISILEQRLRATYTAFSIENSIDTSML